MTHPFFQRRARAPSMATERAPFLAVAVVLALFFVPEEPGTGGYAPGGGDSVGSLPSHSGNGPADPTGGAFGGGLLEGQPTFSLVGQESELRALIAGASGDGYVWITPLNDRGAVRMTFHGRVTVLLSRPAFQASFVQASFDVAPAYAGGLATIDIGSRTVALQPLQPGPMNLRLVHLARSGVVDEGVLLRARSPFQETSMLLMRGSADFVRVHLAD